MGTESTSTDSGEKKTARALGAGNTAAKEQADWTIRMLKGVYRVYVMAVQNDDFVQWKKLRP